MTTSPPVGSRSLEVRVRADVERAAEPPHLGGTDASADPRTVTTGGKIEANGAEKPWQAPKDIDPLTGEPFDAYFVGARCGVKIVRHLVPYANANAGIAQVDALAFTVVPPDDGSMRWVMEQMRGFMPIDRLQARNGCFGFKQSVRFGDGAGLIAWGGQSQRNRVYFSVQGKGCAMVEDWGGLAHWLHEHGANIKRADVAYDDFKGEVVSIPRF
jgi:phage replication initiation protein